MKTGICISIMAILMGCGTGEPQWYSVSGKTMGTTYHVQYQGVRNMHREIDALLQEINNAVSTYVDGSTISEFNRSGQLAIPLAGNGEPQSVLHGHFLANLESAYEVFRLSGGFFDPTVGPLVEAWGFGKDGPQTTALDSSTVSELLQRVGMQYVEVRAGNDTIVVRTLKTGMHLDFSALAKGYGVDRVFDLILQEAGPDVFVEIGGEVRAGGKSPRGDDWIVGINTPDERAGYTDLLARLSLRNAAMATSGNYRNFYILEGRKVWHTINPKSGYPEENDLLSATITHPRCMMADALATACMAMGTDDAIGLIRSAPGAAGFFIYLDRKGDIATFATENLEKDILPE